MRQVQRRLISRVSDLTVSSNLTCVHCRLSLAQPLSYRFGNHSVQQVICLLHLIIQHLHALLQLARFLLLL